MSSVNLNHERIIKVIGRLLEPWLAASMSNVINEESNLLGDLELDSVAIMQLILGIEKEFDIKIEDYELESDVFSRVGNLIDIIERKVNAFD